MLVNICNNKEIYSTDGPQVSTTNISRQSINNLTPCNHEEADTRIMVHVADAVLDGHSKIMIRTVDSDVVVLAVSCLNILDTLEELWVHVGTGKNHQFVSCDAITASLAEYN